MTVTIERDAYADVSNPAGEPIAVWERVSTDMSRQEIASQTRDLRAYIGAGSYRVERVFRIEASAYHGEHDPELRAALADVREGIYAKIVAATSSRFERRGWKPLLAYMIELDSLGGRLVAVDNPAFGDMSNLAGGVTSLMSGDQNHGYSDAISKNVNRTFRWMDDQGVFRGAPPAGYAVEGARHGKRLVPAPERRTVTRKRKAGEVTVTLPSAADVIQAFRDAAADSTVTIGKRIGMTPDAIAKLLRNKVYSTGQYQVKRHDGVTVIHRCEPLVSPAVQARAIAALKRRRTGDNVTSRALAKDDFSGALWCAACEQGTMLRYYGGGRRRSDGSVGPKTRRYRCTACGRSVDADKADAEVHAYMSARTVPYLERRWVDGDDHQAELDRIELELRELPGRGLDDDAEDAERARLRAERKRLQAMPRETGHWESGFTGKSEGQRWAEMQETRDRRAWLLSGEFRIYVRAKPGRTGAVSVELVYMDDDRPESGKAA